MKKVNNIDELLLLDDIENICEEYKAKYGHNPSNLSNWNMSNNIIDIKNNLFLPSSDRNESDYIFSYSIRHSSLISKIGYKSPLWKSLITHSGSSSIVSVIKWLSTKNVKKVLIICPRYFTVPALLNSFEIEYEVNYCERTTKGYMLPENIQHEHYDAIWITDPVYCTGEYLNKSDLQSIYYDWSSNNKYFIIDNCLSDQKHYFGINITPSSNICVIISPNKNVCVNGYKFAALLFHKDELSHFDSWSDVLQGCLPESSVQALEFFTHGQYDDYLVYFNNVLKKQEKILFDLLSQMPVLVDKNASGYLRTVYFPKINALLGKDIPFLKTIFFATGASFIPNIRNELNHNVGFSFRINLAAFDVRAQGGLIRIANALINI